MAIFKDLDLDFFFLFHMENAHYVNINDLECTQNLNISYTEMMMLDLMGACVSDLGQL